MALELSLFSDTGEAKGKVEFPAALANAEGSRRTLHEVITTLRNNQRRGTSETKTRSNVSGGGRKPWKQKGTGNARSGSNRSPLWRKGGIIFGPHPRSYRVDLTVDKKRLALLTALTEKAKAGDISVLESFPENEGKTGPAGKLLAKLSVQRHVLLVLDKKSPMMLRSVKNLGQLCVADVHEINAWTIYGAPRILITKAALDALVDRFPAVPTAGQARQSLGGGKG